jgi:hypothetical protein
MRSGPYFRIPFLPSHLLSFVAAFEVKQSGLWMQAMKFPAGTIGNPSAPFTSMYMYPLSPNPESNFRTVKYCSPGSIGSPRFPYNVWTEPPLVHTRFRTFSSTHTSASLFIENAQYYPSFRLADIIALASRPIESDLIRRVPFTCFLGTCTILSAGPHMIS